MGFKSSMWFLPSLCVTLSCVIQACIMMLTRCGFSSFVGLFLVRSISTAEIRSDAHERTDRPDKCETHAVPVNWNLFGWHCRTVGVFSWLGFIARLKIELDWERLTWSWTGCNILHRKSNSLTHKLKYICENLFRYAHKHIFKVQRACCYIKLSPPLGGRGLIGAGQRERGVKKWGGSPQQRPDQLPAKPSSGSASALRTPSSCKGTEGSSKVTRCRPRQQSVSWRQLEWEIGRQDQVRLKSTSTFLGIF